MRILHVTYSNAAGVATAYARALGDAGHDCRVFNQVASDFGGETGEPTWTWAEAIFAYDLPMIAEDARRSGKPWAYVALGSHGWRQWDDVLRQTAGVALLTSQVDFCRFGAQWIPKPLWPVDFVPYISERRHKTFTVAHCPSALGVKGSRQVVAACREAGVALDLVTGVSHDECLRRKARCHVLVDMVAGEAMAPERLTGYAVNGMEAMALGIPVLGQASAECAAAQEQAPGSVLPYLPTTPERLAEDIVRLRDDRRLYGQLAARGRRVVARDQYPPLVARRLLDAVLVPANVS